MTSGGGCRVGKRKARKSCHEGGVEGKKKPLLTDLLRGEKAETLEQRENFIADVTKK